MNSLEFINIEIKGLNKEIEYLQNKIIEDKIYPGFVKSHKERIEELKTILQQLEQIKSELEAWYVVKKHCDYQDRDRFNCIPEGFYIIEPIKGKDFLIVKKALEVEDEI